LRAILAGYGRVSTQKKTPGLTEIGLAVFIAVSPSRRAYAIESERMEGDATAFE